MVVTSLLQFQKCTRIVLRLITRHFRLIKIKITWLVADGWPDASSPPMQNRSTSTTIFHLEMWERARFCPKPAPPGFEVAVVDPADPQLNRRFYCAVGSDWNWTDRLKWSEDDWHEYVHRDALSTWVGRLDGQTAGYFELEAQADGNVEIAYFGLMPEFIGRGLGGPLLSASIEIAWNLPNTRRVWVHTCTDDHHHALANYLKRGFELFKTEQIPIQA